MSKLIINLQRSVTMTFGLPHEITANIFQFLDIPSLGAVAQVCKNWELVQKNDEIWRNFYCSYLDEDTQPTALSSWKEGCKIIHRWMKGEAQIEVFPNCYKEWHIKHDFAFIGNELIEVKPIDQTCYAVCPCIPNQQSSSPHTKLLDLSNLQAAKPICTDIVDSNWVALDANGSLLCYDITTGEGKKFTDPADTAQITSGKICISQDEILTYANRKIKIWNRNTGLVDKILLDDSMREIWSLHSSNHFIICAMNKKGLLAIHKHDKTCQIIADARFTSPFQTAATGSYVATLGQDGTLLIFKENQSELELIYSIEDFKHLSSSSFLGSLKFYRNWLLVSKSDELKIVNTNNGQIIACITHGQQHRNPQVRLNSNKLCLRTVIGDPHFSQTYTYTIYDFEKSPITKLMPSFTSIFNSCTVQ